MKTMARLRHKFGGTIEDVDLNAFSVDIGTSGWQFIGKLKNKVSKEVFNRYSMIYIPDGVCTVHDRKECYCYAL